MIHVSEFWSSAFGEQRYGSVCFGKRLLGTVEIMPNGYKLISAKKVLPTIEAAAKGLIARRISAAEKEAKFWADIKSKI